MTPERFTLLFPHWTLLGAGLAVVLARSGGFASPLTALPGAASAVIHCLIGIALAVIWRRSAESLRDVSAR